MDLATKVKVKVKFKFNLKQLYFILTCLKKRVLGKSGKCLTEKEVVVVFVNVCKLDLVCYKLKPPL